MEFRNFLLAALSKADLQALVPHLSEVSLQRGEVVLPDGEPAAYVYFPSSAVLSVVTVMDDGRYAESSTIGREGCAGLLDAIGGADCYHRIFAQVAGSAIRLPARVFREQVDRSPVFARLLFRHAQADFIQTQQFVACNVLHTAEQRLARWLLMTADRVGANAFWLTQDYMAIMTGVQRSTISALASEFKQRGLIRYSRGALEILDRQALKTVACECAGVAHEIFLARREPD